MSDFMILTAAVVYVVIGFGAVNAIDIVAPDRPRILSFVLWPALFFVFAFSRLENWK